jgi:lipocalin/uncharacterized protein YbjT (DUF2867 family)
MILLTGATGYIGSRLLRVLEEGGCAVRCLARRPERIAAGRATTEVVPGDCLDEASLVAAMDGVDQAYYLVHSMASGPGFAALDRQAAANFGRAAARAGVRRIVYLGGLGDDPHSLSTHLKSRLETGEALREAGVPVVEFRASIVIGAGSLSFEMIRALVERLPVMICPRWVDTRTQPIAIDDVLAYLRAALDLPDGGGAVFEIGGPEVISYGEMMREYARLRRLRRFLIPVPVLTPRLSGLWLALVTPAQARVGRALVEGLRNPTVVHSQAARETFEIRPMPLREAFMRAIDEGAATQHKIDTRQVVVDAPPAQAFAPIRRIGGGTGWYFGDALWRLRGWIDGWLGGAGMPRHRRDPDACAVGDVIDGWRVEAYEPDRLLRLAAGLKLPGRGWLEFRVTPLGDGERSLIRQTATFDPRGVTGRLYWYAVLPLHALIFRGLLRRIARRAVPVTPPAHKSTSTRSVLMLAFAVAAVLQTPAAAAQTAEPPRPVPFVDLDRYAGDWFEIARLPNRFQQRCVGDVRASYARRADGRIDVVNQCRTADGRIQARGIARVVDDRTFARLKVRFAPAWLTFLPFVWGDYWIIGLAEDYSWAVVGSPDREYLWILARTPRLDEKSAAAARGGARANGFDVERLILAAHGAASLR